MNNDDVYRFVLAQNETYTQALEELKNGKKESHWMWYVFPQLKGIGNSENAQFYGIRDIDEAETFMRHPILGKHLIEISETVLNINNRSALQIFGNPDYLKLHSCMSLFAQLNDGTKVFQAVIDKYFNGIPDEVTINILKNNRAKL
ncbi:DUF1810 domain-containing protein [Pedobacter aquatilis]|uniref:DUF1810 domain-containing protein n=1 Tax=Pedobacter aquatilis TaxID=351343 RepID=UPI0025B5993B|nr:DUF1810 domain-containing protein [Pedobacter aquatilis]MDN3588808.1 DUF1810 domain-containing protein [Pedobacter aquatilis]